MRIELLLFFCLACLAFTAQAAPESEKDALLEQKLKPRQGEGEGEGKGKQHKPDKAHHRQHHRKHHGSNRLDHASSIKHTRAAPLMGAEATGAAEEAGRRLLSQDHLLDELRNEVTAAENDYRQLLKSRKHEMQVADSLHIATTGKLPPKFPTITRIGSALGLSSAVLNVINFMFAVKSTALATDQFAPPPIPPTLIDTAVRWDGHQHILLPPPSDGKGGFVDLGRRSLNEDTKPKDGAHNNLKKRSLAEPSSLSPHAHRRMIKRKKPLTSEEPQSIAERGDPHKLAKRWVVSAVVGMALGAALAPGLPSMVTGKWKAEVDKPPFDPYNPDILKQKDPFLAAAATPDQALPMPPLQAPPPRFPLNAPPNLGKVIFPSYPNTFPGTNNLQQQPPFDAYSRQNNAPGPGYSYGGGSSRSSTPADSQPVLRKRAVESDAKADGKHEKASSPSHLDKRFLFSGGPGSKLAGAVTVGSIVPLVWGSVTHARWRTMNPRDREILKDLDDKPTYGAVGVPGRIPGQLATNAMPGYADYIARLQSYQAKQQATAQAAAQDQYLTTQAMQLREYQQNRLAQTSTAYTSNGASSEPVLRKRDTVCSQSSHGTDCHDNRQTRLDKRGNWLAMGGLILAGLGLGYAQSATQFPTDRDEEKDAKKREMRKQQEAQAQAAQQQQQGGGGYPQDPNAMGGGGAADPFAGMQISGTPLGSGGGDPSANAPSYPSWGSDSAPAYGGGAGSSGAGAGAYGSTQIYDTTGAGGYGSSASGYGSSAATYSAGNTGASAYGPSPVYGSGGSLAASLDAAAGLSNSAGGGTSSNRLRKRDTSDASKPLANDKARSSGHKLNVRSLSKRTPGFANALSIGGTTMFVGTLLGNVFVSSKQKSKPVPLVTPNADTRGPMPIGGDMYTAYLESKRAGQMAAPGQGGVGAGGLGMAAGTPASINDGAAAPAYSPTYGGSSYGGSLYGGSLYSGGGSSLADTSTYSTTSYATTPGSSYPQQDTSGVGGSDAVLKKRSILTKRSLSLDADALRKRSPLGALAEVGSAASILSKAPTMLEAGTGAASLLSKAPAMTELGAGAVSRLGAASRLSGLSGYGSSAAGLARSGAYASEVGLSSFGRSSLAAENTYARLFRPGQAAWGSASPAMASSFRGAGGAGVPATMEDLYATFGRSASARTGYQGFSRQQIMEAEQRAAMAGQKGLAGQEVAGDVPKPGMDGKKVMSVLGTSAGASMMFNGIG
ncbi:uncharacterized protein UTRI_05440_B [Ustilago trichophora]|uniref:Uncharacterized protein n=1 Tax=Ustilago trichophora TaxID=86804 RepID=A0A5C3EML3_9BASI|nr:uncharacterized protein UTRI_05440_B [Ustilago trichophora]